MDEPRRRRMSNPPPGLRHLAHIVALTREGKVEAAEDNLVVTVMAVDATAIDRTSVTAALAEYFGLVLGPDRVAESLDRLATEGRAFESRASFVLSPEERAKAEERARRATDDEVTVRGQWLDSLPPAAAIGTGASGDQLWSALTTFLARVCQRHGAETALLLAPGELPTSLTEPLGGLLDTAIRGSGVDRGNEKYVEASIRGFFQSGTPERSRYISDYLDGMFTFYALGVDDATSAFLREALPRLDIFLDTNFIFGLLGLHDDELGNISQQLVEILTTSRFPFKLYYHQRTLEEASRTLDAIGERLTQSSWSQRISAAAVRSGVLSSVELRYHRMNAESRTDPDAFMARYRNVPVLLRQLGINVFREPPESEEEARRRWGFVAEYAEFKKRVRRDRPLRYESLDHDVAVWLSVQKRRQPARSTLHAGAIFLSADYVLSRYDREVMRQHDPAHLGSVVLPSQMIQLLRPFIPSTASLDEAFARTLAIPEFRASSTGYSKVGSKVLSYLNTIDDLPVETAVEILENELVLAQVRNTPEDDPAFVATIDAAIVETNRRLQDENSALRQQVEQPQWAASAVAEVGGRVPATAVRNELPGSSSLASPVLGRTVGEELTTRLSAMVLGLICLALAGYVVVFVPRADIVSQIPDIVLRGLVGAGGALAAVWGVAIIWEGSVRGRPGYLASALLHQAVRTILAVVAGAVILLLFGIPSL